MTLPQPGADIFRYLPDHRVLLCVPCGYAVQPQAITSHLQRKEHHSLNRKDRQALRARALTHDLAKPEDVQVHDAGVMAVPGLPVMSGYACGFCSHLTTNIYSLKEHGRRQHDKRKRDDVYWREVKLQTFFRGNQMRYFIVGSADGAILDNAVLSEAPQLPICDDRSAELEIKEKPDSANNMETMATVNGLTDAPEPSTLVQEGLEIGPPKGLEAYVFAYPYGTGGKLAEGLTFLIYLGL
jgi:Orsellinic acid/F9775 biosynthesis cluster protein D